MHNDKFYDLIKGIEPLEKKQEINELSVDKLKKYIDKASSQEKKRGGFADPKDIYRAGDKINKGFSKIHATEEVEPIEELSKKTLGSYVKKATRKVADAGFDFGSIHKDKRDSAPSNYIKRTKGIDTAIDKLTKEEVEFSEEELQMIANVITEEEFEQLDELSRKTLSAYIHHAASDMGYEAWKTGKDNKTNPSKREIKRAVGIQNAAARLGEDFEEGIFSEDEITALLEMEQLDELSKETLKSYVAKNKADPVRIKKRGPTTKAQKAGIAKRDAGHEVASSKLAKIHKKESDAAFAAHANKVHEASNRFMKAAHDHLTDKGYTFHGEHKHEGAVYSKYHPHNGVLNTYKVKRGDGIHSNPSIVHTSIQGHSYSGNSPHHHRVSIFQDHENEHSHENIAAGVHKYVDSTEHDSHHDVSRDHHWKDEQAKKNK